MPKNGNITGQVFDIKVTEQIEARQEFLGAKYKTDSHLIYENNSNSFLRLASSVNVGTLTISEETTLKELASQENSTPTTEEAKKIREYQGKNQLTQRGLNETLTGDSLARKCILFGGVVGYNDTLNPTLKFGIVNNNGQNQNGVDTYDYVSNNAEYGWGGISSRGYVPMPLIESADVSYYNRGALANATIKIKVFSVEQLQIFDVLYFRIGYTMLLEWGHNIWINNEKQLQNRTNFNTDPLTAFFKEGSSQTDLRKAITTQREKDCYNYDAMLGKVTNFNWQFNTDGSYDIELKLVGLGDIIESLKINTSVLQDPSKASIPDKTTEDQLKKKNEQASLVLQSSAKKETSASTKKADAETAYDTTINNATLRYNDIYGGISDTLNQEYNIARIATFGDTTASATTNISRINGIIKAVEKKKGNKTNATLEALITKLGNLKKEQSKVTGAKDELDKKTNEAQAEIDEAIANSKAATAAQQAVEKQREINQLSPNTSIQNKNKSLFNEQLWKWRTEIDNIYSSNSTNKDLYRLSMNAKSSNAATTGTPNLKLNFYYVRLGYMLEWIQNNLLIYDPSKKYSPKEKETFLTTGTLPEETPQNLSPSESTPPGNPYFTINTISAENFCLRFPTQFSSDPKVCVIPSKYIAPDNTVLWDILPELKDYFVDGNENAGYLMNIRVNVDFLSSILDRNLDANGKVNLLSFLKDLCNSLNDCLGNVNRIEPIFDDEKDMLTFIEGGPIDDLDKQIIDVSKDPDRMAIFTAYGIGDQTSLSPNATFLKNIGFQVQLPPNMAQMATISAQSSGNILGENATSLSKLNVGLTDRLITFKLDKASIDNKTQDKTDPKYLFKTTLESTCKQILEVYQNRNYASDTIDSLRSSNRDMALYLTGADSTKTSNPTPSPFFIPFNLALSMNGISGMKNYERFSITEEILPYSYRSNTKNNPGGVINFLIKGISHSISNNTWETRLETISVNSIKNK